MDGCEYKVRGANGHYELIRDGVVIFDHWCCEFLADWAVSLNESAAKRRSSQWDTNVIVDSPLGG